MKKFLTAVVGGFVVLINIAGSLWVLYCTLLAFIGGTVWPFGWELGGSFVAGVIWVFLISPLIMTLFYWLTMLFVMPLLAIFGSD